MSNLARNLIVLGLCTLGAAAQAAPMSLYERMGGIHKIAAAVDYAVEMEAMDATLNMNPRFKMGVTDAPRSAVKQGVAAYLSQLAGGPQKAFLDIASIQKYFAFNEMQMKRAWEIRWMAFDKAGVTKKDFLELRGMFEKKVMTAKSMMPPATEPFLNKESLYARLGGLAPISMVVNDFIDLLATDGTIGANPNVVKSLTSGRVTGQGLKYLVTEQLAAAAGGPFMYTGKTMADSHKGLMITGKEWESAAMLLKKVLDKYHVPTKEQGEIFAVIASTRGDIVGK